MPREILKERPVSSHPDDSHLSWVLCKHGEEFVTWMKNTYDDGLLYGHYFENYEFAEEDFWKRG